MKQPKQNNNELIKLLANDKQPFPVFSAPISQVHKVTLDDEFRETYQFEDLVEVLDQAQEGDRVQIKLTTPGGSLQSIIPLISSLKNTEAYVHVHAISDVSSAGTFILMLADSFYINEYSSVMFHNIQYSAGGHGGNVEAYVKHTTKSSEILVRDLYDLFLTNEEIDLLLHGMELYLTPEECHKRFDDREELRAELDAEGKEVNSNSKDDAENNIYAQFVKDNPEKAKEIIKDITDKYLEDAYDEPVDPELEIVKKL